MTLKVAILGCGPAGLMAAAGARSVGTDVDVRVFSHKQKSNMFGAQYLHQPIPGYSDPDKWVWVNYTLRGDSEGYRRKVYGDLPFVGQVSVEALMATHKAWDIREAYDRLWDDWKDDIVPVSIDAEGIVSAHKMADLVINTIPAPAICWQGHSFRGQEIWAAGEAHEWDIKIPYNCNANTVICNGEDHPTWYRLSNIYGHKTVEWSLHTMPEKPPIGKPSLVTKPIDHNCTCWPDLVTAGRYGAWKKDVLSHHAYATGVHATLEARATRFNEA